MKVLLISLKTSSPLNIKAPNEFLISVTVNSDIASDFTMVNNNNNVGINFIFTSPTNTTYLSFYIFCGL